MAGTAPRDPVARVVGSSSAQAQEVVGLHVARAPAPLARTARTGEDDATEARLASAAGRRRLGQLRLVLAAVAPVRDERRRVEGTPLLAEATGPSFACRLSVRSTTEEVGAAPGDRRVTTRGRVTCGPTTGGP